MLHPAREDKPYLAPQAPRAHQCVGIHPGRFHASGSVHLPRRQQRVRLQHPSWTRSWDGEASTWTDTCARGRAGREQPAHGHSPEPELRQSWKQSVQRRSGTGGRWPLSPPHRPGQGGWSKGSSQRRRNVLLHGREEITAKECAVPRPGLGRAREKAAGRKNKLRLSQGYGPLVTIFFPSPS